MRNYLHITYPPSCIQLMIYTMTKEDCNKRNTSSYGIPNHRSDDDAHWDDEDVSPIPYAFLSTPTHTSSSYSSRHSPTRQQQREPHIVMTNWCLHLFVSLLVRTISCSFAAVADEFLRCSRVACPAKDELRMGMMLKGLGMGCETF